MYLPSYYMRDLNGNAIQMAIRTACRGQGVRLFAARDANCEFREDPGPVCACLPMIQTVSCTGIFIRVVAGGIFQEIAHAREPYRRLSIGGSLGIAICTINHALEDFLYRFAIY